MEHDEFIGQVQHRARLSSRGEAERATRASLETLAERIGYVAATNLAAQLHLEIGEHLRRTTTGESRGEQFGYDEFIDRDVAREEVDRPDSVFHARVVIEVVDEAATGRLMGKVREQLPDQFDRLFEAGSQGQMRRTG